MDIAEDTILPKTALRQPGAGSETIARMMANAPLLKSKMKIAPLQLSAKMDYSA